MPRGRPKRRSGRSEQEEKSREEAENQRLSGYWDGLSAEDRERVWSEALSDAPPFLAGRYRKCEHTNPEHAALYWRSILGSYLEKQVKEPFSQKKPRQGP